MREKIARKLMQQQYGISKLDDATWDKISKDDKAEFYIRADQILSLMREEIKKIENPYDLNTYNYTYDKNQAKIFKEIWENCRQAVLKIVEEK